MITETKTKIHFRAFTPRKGRVHDTKKPPTVTLFSETGRMQFNRYAVEQMQMKGKFVRFFYEPVKKVIGWKVVSEINQNEMKLWKVCRVHKNGVWQVSIRQMLNLFQLGRRGLAPVYRNMVVKKYRETELLSAPNDTYFYVELKDEYADRGEEL